MIAFVTCGMIAVLGMNALYSRFGEDRERSRPARRHSRHVLLDKTQWTPGRAAHRPL